MQAIKRAISLFLAGITALTMMCAGTISAEAEQTSKLWVEALDVKPSSIISIGLRGISDNNYNEALKLVAETVEAFGNEERDDYYFVCAEVTLKSNGNAYNFTVLWLSENFYMAYINNKAVSNAEGLRVVAGSTSPDDIQFQWQISSESSCYQSVRSVLENCTQVTAAFGVINMNTLEKELSDGSAWKLSDVTYDVSDFKKDESVDEPKKEKHEYTLTGKENSNTYELAIEGIAIDLTAKSGSYVLHLATSKGNGRYLNLYFSTGEIGKKITTAHSVSVCNDNVYSDYDTLSISNISYNKKEKHITFNLNNNNIGVSYGLKELQKNNEVYITLFYLGKDKKVPDQSLTVNAEWNSSSVSKPKKTTLTVKKTDEKYTFSWGKVSDADKYQIYYSTDGKKYTKLANVSGKKTSYSTTKLDESKTYSFKIRSYKKVDGKTYYSKFSKVVKK